MSKQNRPDIGTVKTLARSKVPEANVIVSKSLLLVSAISLVFSLFFAFRILSANTYFIVVTLVVLPVLMSGTAGYCLYKKGNGWYFQYLLFGLLLLFLLDLDLMSGYKAKLLLALPILLAMRYYNRRFLFIVSGLTEGTLFLSVLANAFLYEYTEFIDINTVSFDAPVTAVLEGKLFNNIIDLHPDPATLFYNGIFVTFIPLSLIIAALTLIAEKIMKINLAIFIESMQSAAREAEGQLELSRVRTATLLSQVQPHFLYNALSTIAYYCKKDPETAQKLTMNFSTYLRNNIDTLGGESNILFTKELEHTKNYLDIEKIRFGERLHVEYDVRYTDFSIPALLLQPIVENAVKHGVCQKTEGGTVTVSSREEGDFILLCVKDDGVGFDVNAVKNDGRSHIGLQNVGERIEKLLGGRMEVESQIGVGTTVTLFIPKENV